MDVTGARSELAAAYEGLESSFPSAQAERGYREAMLARSTRQADLVASLVDSGSVLEIGCGNGRLLIELGCRGVAREGLGIDTAGSRIDFARRWARDEGLDQLQFEVADALDVGLPETAYDAVVCITGAFAYFEPVAVGSAPVLLQRWRQALRPRGLLVLELYPHPEIVRLLDASSGVLRVWRELDPEDPWRFYLSELRIEGGVLIHEKTFIHRTSAEVDAGRRERLMLYSPAEIRELVELAGFVEVACRNGWTDTPYGDSENMVVTGRAPS